MFVFTVGQIVRAVVSAQGLEKSKTYVVRKLFSKSTAFGTFVSYTVEPVMKSVRQRCASASNPHGLLTITNGHIVLEDATALAAAEKFEAKLAAKRPRRSRRDDDLNDDERGERMARRRDVEQEQAEVESAPSLGGR